MARSWHRRAIRVSTRPTRVPDTVLGRFDLIRAASGAACCGGCAQGEAAARDLAQGLFDAFCRDMDRQSARDGHRRSGRAATDAARRRGVLWARPGLRGGARCAERRRAGGGARSAMSMRRRRNRALRRNGSPTMCGERCMILTAQAIEHLLRWSRDVSRARDARGRGVSAYDRDGTPLERHRPARRHWRRRAGMSSWTQARRCAPRWPSLPASMRSSASLRASTSPGAGATGCM